MPSAESITDEVCQGLGSLELENLEVHLDIRNHGLEGLLEDLLEGLLAGVLGSEPHLEPKHTCLHYNQTPMAKVKGQSQRATSKAEASKAWRDIQQQ